MNAQTDMHQLLYYLHYLYSPVSTYFLGRLKENKNIFSLLSVYFFFLLQDYQINSWILKSLGNFRAEIRGKSKFVFSYLLFPRK